MEFKTVFRGKRIEGSEVCFLPKAYDRNLVTGLLGTRDMRCLPADSVLDVPRGAWYFYARNDVGLVSPHRSLINYLGRAVSDELYKSFRLDLVAAATWELGALELGPDDRFIAWAELDDESYQAPVVMAEPGATKVLVPADVRMIPIVTHNGDPVWIGDPIATEARATWLVRRRGHGDDRMNVLSWIFFEDEQPHAPPRAVLKIGDEQFATSAEICAIRATNFALIEFLDVPRRAGTITLEGDEWQPASVTFEPRGDSLFVRPALVAIARHRDGPRTPR